MLIVADFGRFSTDVACLQKDIVAPYEHVVQSYVDDHSNSFSQRHILLYFQGRIHRKAVSNSCSPAFIFNLVLLVCSSIE